MIQLAKAKHVLPSQSHIIRIYEMNLSKRGSLAIMADNRAPVFLSFYPCRLLAAPPTVPRSHWLVEIARGKTSIKQQAISGLLIQRILLLKTKKVFLY